MSTPLKRLATMTGGALLLRLVTQAAALALAARFLGPESYARTTSALSLATVLGILPNLGAGLSVIAHSERQHHRVADNWRFAWPQHVLLGPCVALAYLGLAPWITGQQLALSVWLAFAASEIVIMPLITQLAAMLQAIDRVPHSQLLQWLVLALRVAGLVTCVILAPLHVEEAYALAIVTATLAGMLIALVVVAAEIPLWHRPRLPRREEWRDGLIYCATSGVGSASMEADKVVAVHVVDTYHAGLYATMSRIVSAGALPVIGLMMSAQPRLFEYARTGNPALRQLVPRLAWTCAALGAVAAIGLNLCAPVLHVLLGQRFEEIQHFVPWISLAMPAMCLRLAGTNIMLTMGRTSLRIAIDVGGILLLTLALAAGGRLAGLAGLGLGLACSEALTALAAWSLVFFALRSPRESAQGTKPPADPVHDAGKQGR